jgi:hypothetical protein
VAASAISLTMKSTVRNFDRLHINKSSYCIQIVLHGERDFEAIKLAKLLLFIEARGSEPSSDSPSFRKWRDLKEVAANLIPP